MHAMVAKHYLGGAAYPIGGSASIAQRIEAVLKKHGAQLITSAEVQSIIISAKKATGVKLADGREIKAKAVISGIGVINTFKQLLPDSLASKQDYLTKLQAVSPSMAHLGLYIGLKGSHQELDLKATNLWIYPNENPEQNIAKFIPQVNLDFPVVYISFPSSKDPLWDKKHPGKSTIEIVVPAPYSWFQKWQDSKWQKRGEEYDQLKKTLTDRLLAILLEKMPQLKDKIHYVELSTPLSTTHFCNYKQGEIYGINHDPARFQQTWLRPQTSVKGLYLTGQDILTCGVGGALCAGVLTAISVLGPFQSRQLIKLMRPIKRKKT
ncbi:MAG: NAD(P)/FAD-dependent oxidoreductase [Proteobacteria bacterium]|nr:NAD(P)/FAD-dependent oxidoreductase [Pseudomonadota bacterium]